MNDLDIITFLTFIFDDVADIIIGPVLLIYVNSIFKNKYQFKDYFLHLIVPFVYLTLISIPILSSIVLERFVFDYLKFLNNHKDILFLFFTLYMLTYLLITINKLKVYKQVFKNNFSNFTKGDLKWIYYLLLGLIVVTCIDLIITVSNLFSYKILKDFDFILILESSLLLYLGYYGITQQRVFLPNSFENGFQELTPKKVLKKSTINFSTNDLMEIKRNLYYLFETEKPFLNEDLTLQKLAESLSLTDKKLSTFLNQHLKISFYDLINKHRVIAVKEKMMSKEYDNITLLGIAFDSGFKSKTSFNRIFKKETGMSPSQYKKTTQHKLK